MQELY
jgi:hypothetical protein